MAEIRLGYTAEQINSLLNKIEVGETLTAAEKERLLNSNLGGTIDDEALSEKIQNELANTAAFSMLRNSTTRVILGRYIIRYNDLENTLDFSYTDNDIIAPNYEMGSIDNTTGNNKVNTVCIRTVEKIEVDPERVYSFYFLKPAKYFKYYLYTSDGSFISSSDEINTTTKDTIKVATTSDTAFIRFKFAASEETIAAAFTLSSYIDFYKSLGSEVASQSPYEIGGLNSTNGDIEENSSSIRTTNYTVIDPTKKYTVTVPDAVSLFRYFFYDTNKNYISCTNPESISAGGTSTMIPPENAVYMKFMLIPVDTYQESGLIIATNITMVSSNIETVSAINWIRGEYDAYGAPEDTEFCVRTENPISLELNHQYVLTFNDDATWVRYYFYTSDGTFLNRSDSFAPSAGDSITINPPANAALMTIKIGNGISWEDALITACNLIFQKIQK